MSFRSVTSLCVGKKRIQSVCGGDKKGTPMEHLKLGIPRDGATGVIGMNFIVVSMGLQNHDHF